MRYNEFRGMFLFRLYVVISEAPEWGRANGIAKIFYKNPLVLKHRSEGVYLTQTRSWLEQA